MTDLELKKQIKKAIKANDIVAVIQLTSNDYLHERAQKKFIKENGVEEFIAEIEHEYELDSASTTNHKEIILMTLITIGAIILYVALQEHGFLIFLTAVLALSLTRMVVGSTKAVNGYKNATDKLHELNDELDETDRTN